MSETHTFGFEHVATTHSCCYLPSFGMQVFDFLIAEHGESEVLGWVLLYELYKVALDDH